MLRVRCRSVAGAVSLMLRVRRFFAAGFAGFSRAFFFIVMLKTTKSARIDDFPPAAPSACMPRPSMPCFRKTSASYTNFATSMSGPMRCLSKPVVTESTAASTSNLTPKKRRRGP